MRFVAYLSLAVAAAVMGGCSSHKTVIPTQNGMATVETNRQNNTTTITSKEGSMTVGQNAVDVTKLGLPIYPGASAKQSGGLSTQSKTGSAQIIVMTTPDSFDKVYAWYKGQMPGGSEQMHINSGTGSMASFVIGKTGAKEQKSVMITSEKDKTSIMLSVGTKTQ